MARALGVWLAAAIAGWPLAAAAAPHASAKAADCIWADFPDRLKRQIAAAPDMDALDTLMKSWDPSDEEITRLAQGCGVTGSPKRQAGDIAGFVGAAMAMRIWAAARLEADYQLKDADLERLWAAVEQPGAAAMAQNFESGAAEPLQVSQRNLAAALAAIPPLDDTEGRILSAYIYARAQLNEIEADGP